ncbi:MAG: phosphomannomutase/phosphoglucomutase [Alphaproteobacteria bacterium]
MIAHRFDPSILRAYDIRGVLDETLGAADAVAIGCAFGTIVRRRGGRTVNVGYDGRHSSPGLADRLVEGLKSTGVAVRRVGLGPTPMLYFSVHDTSADGGIMVTGSHNPPDHNGFKFMLGRSGFFGEDIQALGKMAEAGDFDVGDGTEETIDVAVRYIDRLVAGADFPADLTVAWDPGNGAAGAVLEALTARIPGRHVLINVAVDGDFPNHHPDPTVPENLEQLRDAVTREGAALGFAFDGDGDRIGVVDAAGRIVWGDQLLALLARDVLTNHPGATIIGDVKCSIALFDEIRRLGGDPVMWAAGHSLVKAKMVETGAKLAGEMSAHIFFADDYYGFDDGLYAAVRTLQLIQRSGTSIGAMLDELPVFVNTPELRFDCSESRKFAVAAEVAARMRAAGAEVVDIDGVRVSNEDGWWLLRASNTQAVLVARIEAHDQAGLDRLKAQLFAELTASGVQPPAV